MVFRLYRYISDILLMANIIIRFITEYTEGHRTELGVQIYQIYQIYQRDRIAILIRRKAAFIKAIL